MADDERDEQSLELPSFGLRRRKGRRRVGSEESPAAADESATEAPAPEPPAPAAPPETQAVEQPAARPLFADETDPTSERTDQLTVVEEREPGPDLAPEPTPAGEKRRAEKAPRESGGMPWAMLTGLLIGLLTVGLTWVSLRGCEVAKGTSSCGGPGLLILVAIMILMILVGTAMLRLFRLPDPGSTSFLAVGLIAVLALLFLVDLLFNWWMVIVIPLIGVATFALSHWVTTAFVEPARD